MKRRDEDPPAEGRFEEIPPLEENLPGLEVNGEPLEPKRFMRAGRPQSEATTIEQSRAIAQVQGALILAQQRPRDELRCRERMKELCKSTALAHKAFYSYSRGDGLIRGSGIRLAEQLARCWGNIDYGVIELARDDARRVSEMMAYAWDVEENVRTAASFLVPHARDTKTGVRALTDLRDIYENNANAGARRLREAIFRLLPRGFVVSAEDRCRKLLEAHDPGKDLLGSIEAMLESFAKIGISRARIEKRMEMRADALREYELGVLRTCYATIIHSEGSAKELFPDDKAADATAELRKLAATNGKPKNGEPKNGPPEPQGSLLGDEPPKRTKRAAKPASPPGVAHRERQIALWLPDGTLEDLSVKAASQKVGKYLRGMGGHPGDEAAIASLRAYNGWMDDDQPTMALIEKALERCRGE